MSFAAIRSQNRSQEWNWGALKLRQSIRFAIIGPKTANFGPKVVFFVIFGQILVFLAHLAPCPTKKEKHWLVSLWWSTKTFPTYCHNCDSWQKDGRFCLKIAIFCLFGPFLTLMADLFDHAFNVLKNWCHLPKSILNVFWYWFLLLTGKLSTKIHCSKVVDNYDFFKSSDLVNKSDSLFGLALFWKSGIITDSVGLMAM